MFATGIESSCPTVMKLDGTRFRVDEMARCGHYERWREDIRLVQELGIQYLRYGPPYYRIHVAPGKYDWHISDDALEEINRLGIVPIADLCHFGVPDWIGDFQNPDWPRHFADYAQAFALRYQWIRFFTPINEILVTATFSALYGWWNESLKSDRSFIRALINLTQANLLAEKSILEVSPTALFIQSESTEYFLPAEPEAQDRAEWLNQRRFLSLDLSYGNDVRACMLEYLLENGLSQNEYHRLLDLARPLKRHCLMGNDYYMSNEHSVSKNGDIRPAGEIFGYYVITKQYYDRYHLPVMHTETNLADAEQAPCWLWKEWSNMVRLKGDGVPIIGFTWYSLTDQVDWDTSLREENGRVNPLGLFDLDRKIRPVGEAYRDLVKKWRDFLPAESVCLCPASEHSGTICCKA
jgi:beta-glucosidase/6-phospho-beta-glucosidase/beta-galactosidase